MERGLEHRFGRAVLDDPAPVHHVDLVGDVPGAREVVRDVEERDLLALLELADEVQDPEPDRHVEHRDRLVREHDLGLHGQGACDGHALTLPPRELMRVLLGDGSSGHEPDRFEQLEHAPAHLAVGDDAVDPQRAGQVVADALDRVQRRERVLEDHLYLRAVLEHAATAADARHVLVLEQDRSRRRLVELTEEACHGALAAPALADERRDLPPPQREAYVVDRTERLAPAPEARSDRERPGERPRFEYGCGEGDGAHDGSRGKWQATSCSDEPNLRSAGMST